MFLPVVLAAYFIFPARSAKNIWLLLASLVFYAWGEPVYILLMIASITANYFFALGIGAQPASITSAAGGGASRAALATHGKKESFLLLVAVAFNIAVIGFFKYESFLAYNFNQLAGTELLPDLQLPLPIGISFYTLQALSYVIDVYRKEVTPQRNILYLGMYIACFPQLIAGPIVRYQTIQEQVLSRNETLEDFASGMRLFIIGLSKKTLLANTVALLADQMLNAGGSNIGVIGAWSGLAAYTFQIFFDFSGYSDMAIGLGRMMGFKYLRNFNYPYISKSITEFWRRWHISLSTFFRDYIYIPLGGSRCSKARWVLNLAVVWAITGLWHGAAWHYVLWGVYYGVLLICEKLLFGRPLKAAPALVQHAYAIAAFMFGWLIFWIPDISQFLDYVKALVGFYGLTGTATLWELDAWEYWPVAIVCTLACTPIVPWLKEHLCAWAEERRPVSIVSSGIANARHIEADSLCTIKVHIVDRKRKAIFEAALVTIDIVLVALLIGSALSIVSGAFNPFIYFQF